MMSLSGSLLQVGGSDPSSVRLAAPSGKCWRGGPRREAPSVVRAQHVTDGVENEAIGMVAWASTTGLRYEQGGLDQLPLWCVSALG
jgi:hypothetical protein